MAEVNCELKKCEWNENSFCVRTSITIQVHDPSNDLHECYDYLPVHQNNIGEVKSVTN